MSVKRNRYCTICRTIIVDIYKKPKFNGKFYYLCSSECYKDYINKVWRPENNNWKPQKSVKIKDNIKERSTKHEVNEFPDY